MLVEPEAPAALAAALRKLMLDPDGRRLLGEAGRMRVAEEFGLQANISRLALKFGLEAV